MLIKQQLNVVRGECTLDKHLTILELHKIIDKHRLYIIDDKHI